MGTLLKVTSDLEVPLSFQNAGIKPALPKSLASTQQEGVEAMADEPIEEDRRNLLTCTA
jgi:hypothetical protein